MCLPPLALLAAATIGSTVVNVMGQRSVARARDKEADRIQAEADAQKAAADSALRDDRRTLYAEQSKAVTAAQGSSVATPRGVFGSRSFFSR